MVGVFDCLSFDLEGKSVNMKIWRWTPKYENFDSLYLMNLIGFFKFGFLNEDESRIQCKNKPLIGDENQKLFEMMIRLSWRHCERNKKWLRFYVF